MRDRLEKLRRLKDRLVYIKNILVTFLGLSFFTKWAVEIVPILPISVRGYLDLLDVSLVVLIWFAALVAYILLSESIVLVNSRIRILENKLAKTCNRTSYRRSKLKPRGIAPPKA